MKYLISLSILLSACAVNKVELIPEIFECKFNDETHSDIAIQVLGNKATLDGKNHDYNVLKNNRAGLIISRTSIVEDVELDGHIQSNLSAMTYAIDKELSIFSFYNFTTLEPAKKIKYGKCVTSK